jgi:hypothetical protein
MKRSLLAGVALAVLSFMTAPALADVSVHGRIPRIIKKVGL